MFIYLILFIKNKYYFSEAFCNRALICSHHPSDVGALSHPHPHIWFPLCPNAHSVRWEPGLKGQSLALE